MTPTRADVPEACPPPGAGARVIGRLRAPAARPIRLTTLEAWSELIRRRCGLAVRESQFEMLAGWVEGRRRLRNLPTDIAYYDVLAAETEGGAEWTALVEQFVSPQTSFFRHPASFEALRGCLLPELRERTAAGRPPLSLWSAGCSTGEEAYSMAMAAMADPALDGNFIVWGADISRRAIETARLGRYDEKAVAELPAEYRRRFLRRCGQAAAGVYEVSEPVRARVRFVCMNLHAPGVVLLNYDVIFCQNVLIYFAPPAVRALVSTLGARLTPGGYLLFGPGEAPVDCPAGLEPVNFDGVRALRRVGRTTREVRP